MHIELRKWADVLIVAPLSANSLAKGSQGLCDNLLTCILRAWDFSKPCLVSKQLIFSSFVAVCRIILEIRHGQKCLYLAVPCADDRPLQSPFPASILSWHC